MRGRCTSNFFCVNKKRFCLKLEKAIDYHTITADATQGTPTLLTGKQCKAAVKLSQKESTQGRRQAI